MLGRNDIEKRVNAWIEWKFPKKDIQKFLITHERKNKLIDNIQKELLTITVKRPQTKIENIAEIIDMATRMFCRAALDYKEQSLMNDHEKQKLMQNKEADYEAEQKELRKEFKIDDTANDKSL